MKEYFVALKKTVIFIGYNVQNGKSRLIILLHSRVMCKINIYEILICVVTYMTIINILRKTINMKYNH